MSNETEQQPQTPTLTADEKIRLLTLQRNVVLAQNQKIQADQQLEKLMAELNRTYQEQIQKNPGFTLREDTLEFVDNSSSGKQVQ